MMKINEVLNNPKFLRAMAGQMEARRQHESFIAQLRTKSYLGKWRQGLLSRTRWTMHACWTCDNWIVERRIAVLDGHFVGLLVKRCDQCNERAAVNFSRSASISANFGGGLLTK